MHGTILIFLSLTTVCTAFFLNPDKHPHSSQKVTSQPSHGLLQPTNVQHGHQQNTQDAEVDEDYDPEGADLARFIWDSVVKSTVNTKPLHSMIGYWNYMLQIKEQIKNDIRELNPELNEMEIEREAENILSTMATQREY